MENIEKENEKELDDRLQRKREKIIQWLKNPYNLTLTIVLISIILLRFYYFWMTKNQPVWWDESEYLSAAKSYAGIIDYKLESLRLPGLPLLLSIFYIIKITQEPVIRFFIGFIPSIMLLFVFYFLIKEMYSDKKIALISVIILGVLWENLFYSNRFQTENISIIFEFLALLIFFKVYLKKEKLGIITPGLSLFWIILFSAISFFIRPGNITFFPSLLVFLIIIHQHYFLDGKHKKVSYTLLIALTVSAFLIFFNLKSIPIIGANYHPDWKLGWSSLNIFSGYYESVIPNTPPIFLYAFLLGLALAVINTFAIIDRIKNLCRDNNYMNFKSDIFNLLLFFSVLFIFIFIIRAPGIEYRWFFMILPPILVFTSKGMVSFSEFIGDFIKNKKIAIIIILIMLSLGVYNQVVHADSIIKNKLNSYSQLRDAGIWIRENSEPEDVVLSRSLPQTVYYSERKVFTFSQINESEFFELVNKTNPKYMLETAFEPHHLPKWGYEPTPDMKKILTPIMAWNAEDGKTPLVIVYSFEKI